MPSYFRPYFSCSRLQSALHYTLVAFFTIWGMLFIPLLVSVHKWVCFQINRIFKMWCFNQARVTALLSWKKKEKQHHNLHRFCSGMLIQRNHIHCSWDANCSVYREKAISVHDSCFYYHFQRVLMENKDSIVCAMTIYLAAKRPSQSIGMMFMFPAISRLLQVLASICLLFSLTEFLPWWEAVSWFRPGLTVNIAF